jgi:hypothetical protein
MLPLDMDSEDGLGGTSKEQRFGPDAVLLSGFLNSEAGAIRSLLDELGASFVRTVVVEESMLGWSLGQALQAKQDGQRVQPALGAPRILVISGMSAQELSMFVDATLELQLPPCIFAAAVPRSIDKDLVQLFSEITGDHERMRQQQQSAK